MVVAAGCSFPPSRNWCYTAGMKQRLVAALLLSWMLGVVMALGASHLTGYEYRSYPTGQPSGSDSTVTSSVPLAVPSYDAEQVGRRRQAETEVLITRDGWRPAPDVPGYLR